MFGGIPENEIKQLDKFWKEFPTLKEELFQSNGSHASIKVENIKKAIEDNDDVRKFVNEYKTAFAGFRNELKEKLMKSLIPQLCWGE